MSTPHCDCSCNTVFDLTRIGLTGSGCIRDPRFMASIRVPCYQNLLNERIYIQTPGLTLEWIQNVAGPTFSRVELARRTQGGMSSIVFIKRPLIAAKSLLFEACIQQIVHLSLKAAGFVRGAAAVYDVFQLKDRSTCFSMEVFQEAVPLTVFLQRSGDVTGLILEILMQLSAMLWHLAQDLGMNHRDLKPSNLMIEEHEVRPLTLRIRDRSVTIQSRYTVSLVDFGFSCIGNRETQVSDIAIGEVYGSGDPCPKEGRDMYMFLAFLYADCGQRLAPELRRCFGKWLQDGSTRILDKIDRLGHEFDPWIYFITGSERISKFDCCPALVFDDLRRLA